MYPLLTAAAPPPQFMASTSTENGPTTIKFEIQFIASESRGGDPSCLNGEGGA